MLHKKITSHISQLQQKKYRKESGEFIVDGIKGVHEALLADAEILIIIVEGNRREEEDIKRIIENADKKNIPIEFAGRGDIGEIKSTDIFPGVLAVVASAEAAPDDLINAQPNIAL